MVTIKTFVERVLHQAPGGFERGDYPAGKQQQKSAHQVNKTKDEN
jgi:hypothetical protein